MGTEREAEDTSRPHSTVITPFMTIQWPGNVQRNGYRPFVRGAEGDGEIVAGGDDIGVKKESRCGECSAARRRRARR